MSSISALKYLLNNSDNSLGEKFSILPLIERFPNKLSVQEFTNFQLADKPLAERAEFLGSFWDGPINYITASPSWYALVRDKGAFQSYFASLGYPLPKAIAHYSPDGRTLSGSRALTSEHDLIDWLTRLNEPVLAKPIASDVGIGIKFIERSPDKPDHFVVRPGGEITTTELARSISALPYGGYLFQESVSNAPIIERLLGKILCTVRFCVLRGRESSLIHRAFVKIRVGEARNDNWDLGRSGNALGMLGPRTGEFETILWGKYPDMQRMTDHPELGVRLVGERFPNWSDVSDLCLSASRELKGLGIQHWDVALTEDGPCLIEVNEDGSLLALQGCGYKGFFDDQLKEFLAVFGHDLTEPRTQAFAVESGKFITEVFARDNAFLGRGTLYDKVTTMK